MKGMRVGNEFSATREHEEGGTDRTGLRGRVAETTQGSRLLFWSWRRSRTCGPLADAWAPRHGRRPVTVRGPATSFNSAELFGKTRRLQFFLFLCLFGNC